jgi:adenylate cyclase
MELDPNGGFAVGSGTSLISGSFTVEGDTFCTRSSAGLLGRKFCSPVYRNPEAGKGESNDYVFPDASSVWYFSPSP